MREFTSIGAFAVFIAQRAALLAVAEHAGLERAAKLIEAEAKSEIGTYQGAAGPFAAWAPLAPATLAKKAADTPLLETGELRDSIEHTVSGNEAEVGSNLEIAVYQELGTRTIPPRSFLGHAAVTKEDEAVRLIVEEVVKVIAGGMLAMP